MSDQLDPNIIADVLVLSHYFYRIFEFVGGVWQQLALFNQFLFVFFRIFLFLHILSWITYICAPINISLFF